jgi:hypothetical protein
MDFRDSMQLCPGHADNGSDEHSNASPLPKNDQKWEQHKDEIERFYIRENHSLPLTMHEFQTRYGLKAR